MPATMPTQAATWVSRLGRADSDVVTGAVSVGDSEVSPMILVFLTVYCRAAVRTAVVAVSFGAGAAVGEGH